MKKQILGLFLIGCFFFATAQEQPKVGDVLTIDQPQNHDYKHIDFPKRNILVKRGKLANYKSVYNNVVIVDEVITNDNGSIEVILKKKDGTKFFGILNKVKANYMKAIEAKELTIGT